MKNIYRQCYTSYPKTTRWIRLFQSGNSSDSIVASNTYQPMTVNIDYVKNSSTDHFSSSSGVITCHSTGYLYKITAEVSPYRASGNSQFTFSIFINNILVPDASVLIGVSSQEKSGSITYISPLNNGDTIEVQVKSAVCPFIIRTFALTINQIN